MDLWNEINLPLPPHSSYRTSRDKFDLKKFTDLIQTTLDYLRNLEKLHFETAQLSQFFFLNCKQFRMFRGLQEMKKAHQALVRYLNLDLLTTLENFKGNIGDENESKISFPHRQSLDYILIRFQGLAKLLLRVVGCCKKSARFFLGQIKAGSFYMKGSIFIGTLARVWNLCRDFCKFIVGQYNELVGFREQIKAKAGLGWVGENFEPPENLGDWLGEDFKTLVDRETYDRKLLLRPDDIQNFIDQLDGDLSSALKRIRVETDDEKIIEDEPEVKKIKTEKDFTCGLEDFTPISRKKILEFKTEIKSEETAEHSISSLTSKSAVTNFVKNETFYRKTNKLKSLTISRMNKKVWKEFKDDIRNKLVLMQEEAFVSYVKDYLEEYKISSE